jgi:hypothetical protein
MFEKIHRTNTDEIEAENSRPERVIITPTPGSSAAAAVAPALAPLPSPAAITTTVSPNSISDERTPLFTSNETMDLRGKWDGVQVGFVDQPRKAVEEADALVAEAMKRLAAIFANERHNLEQQWEQKDNVSTEDLRLALQRYRSFFSRLLAI